MVQSENPHVKAGPPFLLGLRGGIYKMVGSSSVTASSLSFRGPCSVLRTLLQPSDPFPQDGQGSYKQIPLGADQEGVMTCVESPAQQAGDQNVPNLFPYAPLDLLGGQRQVSQRAGLEGGAGGGVFARVVFCFSVWVLVTCVPSLRGVICTFIIRAPFCSASLGSRQG